MTVPSYQPAVALEFFKAGSRVEDIAQGETIFKENKRGRRIAGATAVAKTASRRDADERDGGAAAGIGGVQSKDPELGVALLTALAERLRYLTGRLK
jgi:hypothetical protein